MPQVRIVGTEFRWFDDGNEFAIEGENEGSASAFPAEVSFGSTVPERLWYVDEHGDRRYIDGQESTASGSVPNINGAFSVDGPRCLWRGSDGNLYFIFSGEEQEWEVTAVVEEDEDLDIDTIITEVELDEQEEVTIDFDWDQDFEEFPSKSWEVTAVVEEDEDLNIDTIITEVELDEQEEVTIDFDWDQEGTLPDPVVENVEIEETRTDHPVFFEAICTFDAGNDCESVLVEVREFDENGALLVDWSTFQTVNTTPNTAGYATTEYLSDECHLVQFRATPHSENNAGGVSGTTITTTSEEMNNDGSVFCE